jgi:DNA-binding beta-propeller fold protein YncE
MGACGGTAPAAVPQTGLLLLDLRTGSVRGSAAVGEDPLAIAVAPDGRTAYVSDNAPGLVRAVSLPELKVRWTAHTGGRPGPILVTLDEILVSVYETNEIVALDPATGAIGARTPTCAGPGQLALVKGAVVAACAADGGFALVALGQESWIGLYSTGALKRREDGTVVPLPPHLHPFWLSAGPGNALFVAAEGDDEDHDPGGVIEVRGSEVRILSTARDVDQVEVAAGRVFAAAHGERAILVLDAVTGAAQARWAQGTNPVALAADLPLGVLVALTDARE